MKEQKTIDDKKKIENLEKIISLQNSIINSLEEIIASDDPHQEYGSNNASWINVSKCMDKINALLLKTYGNLLKKK